MKKLDFMHTCGTIDRAIADANDALSQAVDEAICEVCPHLPQDVVDTLTEKVFAEYSKKVEAAIEECRSINIDMRDAADDQIDNLNDQLLQAEKDVELYDERFEEARSRISELEFELDGM